MTDFELLVEGISRQNPMQGKKIRAFIAKQDAEYFEFAERVTKAVAGADAALAYNLLCSDILKEQIRFSKDGVYRLEDARIANETIYSQPTMRSYVIGLMLSYLFWPNHYKMYRFFSESISGLGLCRCLEIGSGHGLFSAELLNKVPEAKLDIIDISAESLGFSRATLFELGADTTRTQYILGDFLTEKLDGKYDFIIMGEVLEHVNDALGFLKRAKRILNDDGRIFMSTCVDCPAPDHIYHFHSIDEIVSLIHNAGLFISRDLVLHTDSFTINYCAVIHDA